MPSNSNAWVLLRLLQNGRISIMTKRFDATISGRVQGVGFRFYARQTAAELGVNGYVRNTRDGDVQVVAEGEEPDLEIFLQLLQQGPHSAHVERVDVRWDEPTGEFARFLVRG